MPRISKVEQQRRSETQVRAGKAQQSILTGLGRIIAKNIDGLIVQPGSDATTSATIRLTITADGQAAIVMTYQRQITDSATVTLDDGQKDLPLDDKSTGGAPGEVGERVNP